jgi:hypothetical protein
MQVPGPAPVRRTPKQRREAFHRAHWRAVCLREQALCRVDNGPRGVRLARGAMRELVHFFRHLSDGAPAPRTPPLAWCIEHAPNGDLDAAIARARAWREAEPETVNELLDPLICRAWPTLKTTARPYRRWLIRSRVCPCARRHPRLPLRMRDREGAALVCQACADALRAPRPPTWAELRAALDSEIWF